MTAKHASSTSASPASTPVVVTRLCKTGAYLCLAVLIGSACFSVMANVAGWALVADRLTVLMWVSLPCYALFAILVIASGISGWANRLFSAAVFLPLLVFMSLAAFLIMADALYIDKTAIMKVFQAGF